MRALKDWEMDYLAQQHADAISGKRHPSCLIRKGWEVQDETEPIGRRLLTDEELDDITQCR